MNEEEVGAFLAGHRVALISGYDAGGTLTARRCEYEIGVQGLEVRLDGSRPCFDLSIQPELCFMVDVYPSFSSVEIVGVVVHGGAEWIEREAGHLTMRVDRVISFDFRKAGSSP
jgi:hypothetical protein